MHQLMEQDFVRQRRGVPVRAAAPTSWGEEDNGLRRSRDNGDLLGVAVITLIGHQQHWLARHLRSVVMERRCKRPPCARTKDFLKLAANAGHELSRVAFDLNSEPLFNHKHRPFIEPVAQANPAEFDAAVAGMATRNIGSHFPCAVPEDRNQNCSISGAARR
jgi:hypothetical protein